MGTTKYEVKECEACGREYRASRSWSKYCGKICREQVTEINNQLLADIRMPVKKAAKAMAKLRLRKDDE